MGPTASRKSQVAARGQTFRCTLEGNWSRRDEGCPRLCASVQGRTGCTVARSLRIGAPSRRVAFTATIMNEREASLPAFRGSRRGKREAGANSCRAIAPCAPGEFESIDSLKHGGKVSKAWT